MRKAKVILRLLLLVCSLVLAGSALAANGFAIPRSVIGGGGQPATGGGYILNGTVGESVASGFDQGTTYGLSSGFWWPPGYRVYLPFVVRDY